MFLVKESENDDGSGTILEDESNIAALETVGDLDDLLKMALSD